MRPRDPRVKVKMPRSRGLRSGPPTCLCGALLQALQDHCALLTADSALPVVTATAPSKHLLCGAQCELLR